MIKSNQKYMMSDDHINNNSNNNLNILGSSLN